MVKDGGDLFREMLIENLDIIDRWTILDTGSTDDTIKNINDILVGKKKGELYQEPFINFRESRNRCLELAGTSCKFIIMLDDTYISRGTLREFLQEIRGDQIGDSYSIMIKGDDVKYLSNRIIKSKNKLRWIYTVHEIIQDKDNFIIGVPEHKCHIEDKTNTYMLNRSDLRKDYDFRELHSMIREYPTLPRHLFYLAQTYKLVNDNKKASEYYYKRAFSKFDGFDEERNDALFEFVRGNLLHGNNDLNFNQNYFKLFIEWEPKRPEGYYFIAIQNYTLGKKDVAFEYFKKAYNVGFPFHKQHSLKPTITYSFTPYFLAELCFIFNDYKLGIECTSFFLNHNKPTDNYYNLMVDWHKIYIMLNKMPPLLKPCIIDNNPIFCFVADGGFSKWSGKNILTSGVGGSETWVIEMARYIKQLTNFDVFVFCNCEENEIFEGVKYNKLDEYFDFISKHKIEYCFISRFSEYIPVTTKSYVENIYVILHDIQLSGMIIPIDSKIKNIFCLTESHKNDFVLSFPQFKDITYSLHYGIDFNKFLIDNNTDVKVKNSFIYSSFANRGLLTILKMWPRIQNRYNDATLNIFCDLNNEWLNNNYKDEVINIRNLLEIYKTVYPNIKNHGWVDKRTLSKFWKKSEVWFYPCKFKETFCLTALESAITKTLAITNDLGSLKDTVGDRGVVIPGDATTEEWMDEAFKQICNCLDNPGIEIYERIERNYQWALKHSWRDRAIYFLENFVIIEEKPDKNDNVHLLITEKDLKKESIKEKDLKKESIKEQLSQIDKVYYINLKSRQDRNIHFLNQCRNVNIPMYKVERFNAINGKTYSLSNEELRLFENCDFKYSEKYVNIVGNQLSHFKIFQDMIYNKYNYIIVCQDDIVLKDNFCNYIDELMGDISCNYDCEIVFFGFHKYAIRDIFLPWDLYNNDKDEIPSLALGENLCKLKSSFDDNTNCNNSLGYIVTLKGAKNFVTHINRYGFKFATDFEYNNYLINKDIFYASRMVLATSNPNFGSDVFDNIYNESNNEYNINYNNKFINYLNEYNWTNDFPKNTDSKIIFLKHLINFSNNERFNVLEIGTFVGSSIITIIQYMIKNCDKVVAIDNWYDNNIEKVFKNNVLQSGYKDKIVTLKGISISLLSELTYKFHFIYITQTHKSVDLLIDLCLSWHVLLKNGILAIDNNLNCNQLIINDFLYLKNYEYEQLDGNSTFFIKKIV
jgi:GR25 family glycosyltransferase involved in LPS biosynthesis